MIRVVITGMDLITALGANLASTWPRLLAGETGISRITYFDASGYDCTVAAEARHDNRPPGGAGAPTQRRRGVNLFTRMAIGAWRDAGLDQDPPAPQTAGVAAGVSVNYCNMGTIRHHFQLRTADQRAIDLERFAREGREAPHLFHKRQGEVGVTIPARALGVSGPTLAIDTACAASAFAIGEAFRTIQRGRARVMVAGGGASLVNPGGILAFTVLGALSRNPDPTQASRPFDRQRDGFVMGEGAGAVVLEDRDHAIARGAHIYAELCGYSTTLSGHNLTDPSPNGVCEAEAMRLALADAKMAPEEIGYVAAHGTSTAKNDALETAAIRQALGHHASRVAVSSNKGQIGHTISAAGVCSLICATKAVAEGQIPPTANYRTPDPACDLDYVPNVGRRAAVGAAMVNVFAFGGQNAVLCVRAV